MTTLTPAPYPPAPDPNPQAEQMAHESMLRNLAAQAAIIWPGEAALFARYDVPEQGRVLDVGCGSGEITSRLAGLLPRATLVGLDLLEGPLEHARSAHAALAPRVSFVQGDAFHLAFPDDTFDLVICRHVTQSVPDPARILAEMRRVCRPGGRVHVLSEDYGMLHVAARPGEIDPNRLWREVLPALSRATGIDERIGRKTWSLLQAAGLVDVTIDYVVVDTVRAPRAPFAEVLRAWRDGYAAALAEHARLPEEEVRALFDAGVASILDPALYSVWHLPILSGRKPERA